MQSGHITSTKQIFWSFFRRPSYLDYQLVVNEYKKKTYKRFSVTDIYIDDASYHCNSTNEGLANGDSS